VKEMSSVKSREFKDKIGRLTKEYEVFYPRETLYHELYKILIEEGKLTEDGYFFRKDIEKMWEEINKKGSNDIEDK
jgi:predicted acetyltransferase